MKKKVLSTYIKFFIFVLSNRRNFIPILSIYFLSIPNTVANEIGIYTGIGFLLGFLFEIPSGYLSDTFGHKKTLILSKLSMITSSVSFLVGGIFFPEHAFWFFTVGSILISVGFSFHSGTSSAFFHEYLESIGKEKDFTKLFGKLKGQVSLVSMFFILGLPFLTSIDIFMPILAYLPIDFIGLLAIMSIKNVKNQEKIEKKDQKSIVALFKEAKKLGFLPVSIFLGLGIGFVMGATAFRTVYLEDLGLPIIFMGFVMGLSRFFWFAIGNYVYLLEKHLGIRKIFYLEIFIFTSFFIVSALLSNPYLVGLIMALVIGYQWGRGPIMSNLMFSKYLPDKRYKATMLSINKQFEMIFGIVVSFGIGYVMAYSFKAGYMLLGVLVFILMTITYAFIFRKG